MSEKTYLGIIRTKDGWEDLFIDEKPKQENKITIKSISEFIKDNKNERKKSRKGS